MRGKKGLPYGIRYIATVKSAMGLIEIGECYGTSGADNLHLKSRQRTMKTRSEEEQHLPAANRVNSNSFFVLVQ